MNRSGYRKTWIAPRSSHNHRLSRVIKMRFTSLSLTKTRLGFTAAAVSAVVLLIAASAVTYLWLRRNASTCTGQFELAIIGGEILDGLGSPAIRADLGIRDKRIACIGTIDRSQA